MHVAGARRPLSSVGRRMSCRAAMSSHISSQNASSSGTSGNSDKSPDSSGPRGSVPDEDVSCAAPPGSDALRRKTAYQCLEASSEHQHSSREVAWETMPDPNKNWMKVPKGLGSGGRTETETAAPQM